MKRGAFFPPPPPPPPTQGKAVVAIVGGEDLAGSVSFASRLVSLGYPRVCVLHGGIRVMKTAGLVSVPDI